MARTSKVEALRDLLRRFDGNGMFLGAAAEDDAHLQPVHAAFSLSNVTQFMIEFSTVSRKA